MKRFILKHKKVLLLLILVIIIAIAIIVGITSKKSTTDENATEGNSEETASETQTLIQNYIDGYNNLDTTAMLECFDEKGAVAFDSIDGDIMLFMDYYNAVTDEDIDEYESSFVAQMDTIASFYESYLDYYTTTLISIDSEDETDIENLRKVTVSTTVEYSYNDSVVTDDQVVYFYIYNDKIVGLEYADDEEEDITESVVDDSDTENTTTDENTTEITAVEE